MGRLNAADILELEQQLRSAHSAVRRLIDQQLRGRGVAFQEAVAAHFAQPDGALDAAALAELDLPLLECCFRELQAIDAALKRIDYGVVGVCTECGGCIQVDRLREEPTAQTCASCRGRGGAAAGSAPA